MSDAPYVEVLLDYQQADQDGIQVLAYRQAIHETVDALNSITAERDALKAKVKEMALKSLSDLGQAHDAHTAQLKAEAERDVLREALSEIAGQKKSDEMKTKLDVQYADFEGGYDIAIDVSRAALKGQTNG